MSFHLTRESSASSLLKTSFSRTDDVMNKIKGLQKNILTENEQMQLISEALHWCDHAFLIIENTPL